MNGRVLLLVVVTGLFMAAWDGDQAAMHAAIAKRSPQRATQMVLSPGDRGVSGGDAQAPLHLLTRSPNGQDASHTANTASADEGRVAVPLPDGIAAGIYQAVNQSGQTSRVAVSEKQARSRAARDFYMVDSQNGDRWYFIRVLR